MTDRELMQQALNALEEYVGVVVSVNDPNDWTPKVADAGEPARKAIEALRARLAQPEPVAMVQIAEDYHAHVIWMEGVNPVDLDQKFLYTAPPQREWQGLTDDDINDHWITAMWNTEGTRLPIPEFARAIEAKLKEKNSG